MKTTRYVVPLLLLLFVMAACNKEEKLVEDVPAADGRIVLNFSASLPGTRSVREEVETDIEGLDVFIFPNDGGGCLYHGYYSADDRLLDGEKGSLTLVKKKEDFEVGEKYLLYMIANCSEETRKEFADFDMENSTKTVNDLKSITQVTADIHLTGSGGDGAPMSFLMDGKAYTGDESQTAITLNDGSKEDKELEVELHRAAAKIVVEITAKSGVVFPEQGERDDEEGNPQVIRYNYVLANMREDACLLAEGGLSVTPKLKTSTYTASGMDIRENAEDHVVNSISLTTYSNSHEWMYGAMDENETYLVVRVPILYTATKDEAGNSIPVDEQVTTLHHSNYYKIPVVGGKNSKLERNTCYLLKVAIGAPGADDPSRPVPLKDVKYEVKEWTDVEIDIGGDTDQPVYLEVNKTSLELHDVDEDVSIVFASSSRVEVSVEDVSFTDKDGVVHHSNRNYVGDDGKYDADLAALVSNSNIYAEAQGLNGHVNFHSDVPTNNLIRNIKLKITNETGEYEYVDVVQYPLDYITFVLGYYSYRDDFGGEEDTDGDDPQGGSEDVTTYLHRGAGRIVSTNYSSSNNTWTYSMLHSGGKFYSKVRGRESSGGEYIINNYTWTEREYDRRLGWVYTALDEVKVSQNGLFDNPRMYHIQITSTSDTYTLGIPKLENEQTEGSAENAKLVSPSFMLASQLGGLAGSMNKVAAAKHCEKYVEVYEKDGQLYKYDDWRLPTKAEIEIITKYQNTSKDAMDEVLSYERYWSASGAINKDGSESTSTTAYTRCIRDAYKEGTPLTKEEQE